MKKNKGILSLILTAVLVVLLGFTVLVGFGKTGTGAMKNIKLGLDLAGGVSITYQVKDDNPTEKEMSDTIYKLQKRVEQYSTEASVYQEGDDRINIEIPGVTDANAILDELGKPGSLEFRTEDGETVITGSDVKTATAKAGEDDMGNKEYSVELSLNCLLYTSFFEHHRSYLRMGGYSLARIDFCFRSYSDKNTMIHYNTAGSSDRGCGHSPVRWWSNT